MSYRLCFYMPKAWQSTVGVRDGFGIARNHPFLDGNKRTAFLAIGLLLLKNGYVLETDDAEATRTMFALASGALTEAELVEWIRRHSSFGRE